VIVTIKTYDCYSKQLLLLQQTAVIVTINSYDCYNKDL